jgi:enamine deaminase RidA (YjgF/YER057c/UK114 family)
MPKIHLNPPMLFPSLPHGFSQAVVATGARTVFISGQTAWDAGKQIVGSTLAQQARQALSNVRMAAEAAGGSLADVVTLRIYIVQRAVEEIDAIGGVLKDTFPLDPPASTWIGVAFLAMPDFLIEIEAVAVLD